MSPVDRRVRDSRGARGGPSGAEWPSFCRTVEVSDVFSGTLIRTPNKIDSVKAFDAPQPISVIPRQPLKSHSILTGDSRLIVAARLRFVDTTARVGVNDLHVFSWRQIVAKIENVGGTAFVVAEFRAEENAETAPLYRDSIVELFLSDESRSAAGRVAAAFPPC